MSFTLNSGIEGPVSKSQGRSVTNFVIRAPVPRTFSSFLARNELKVRGTDISIRS